VTGEYIKIRIMKNNRPGGIIRKTNNAAGNTSAGLGVIRKN